MSFNENTRVKIPAILHLGRLGYTYLPLGRAVWDKETNIFTEIFAQSIQRINPEIPEIDCKRLLEDISLCLNNDDLGKEFYQRLAAASGIRLIDFVNFGNNSFHVVTELTYRKGEEEFRPDITLLINGMPLAFIEVKKPNNHEGILAERDRINARFKNPAFKKFINIAQILVFSNNMEYDPGAFEPIQGAFYSSTALKEARFHYFREEEKEALRKFLKPEDEDRENLVLKDNNLAAIKYSPEFAVNKAPDSPTNRLLTSLFCKERLAFLLKYGIAYVNGAQGQEKHVMRYPQLFAALAIQRKLDKGTRKGIIWHTQGSGKTALAFFNVHCLSAYFRKKEIIPQFYFIVDRLDLMDQANMEFTDRGLKTYTVNSREKLKEHFREQKAVHNLTGELEITVVNIQKFAADPAVLEKSDYDISIQRIYFLDEVHRSYNPKGSFLSSLIDSDRNAIMIGLTGTPLLIADRKSTGVFGDYIHKYYYNASIADGYTLRLIREGIETEYKILLAKALQEVQILKGDVDRRLIYAHRRFAEPLLDYIARDFRESRNSFEDRTIGGMVVCDSADQAETLFDLFIEKYNPGQKVIGKKRDDENLEAAETLPGYGAPGTNALNLLTAALVLHDTGTKTERKNEIKAFKNGKIDLLFVYNMLLTGFDAHRLKKLYICREIKDHNLLQTLTRVNRPYKGFRYGYVVDFADIRSEFDKTNRAYLDELKVELGDDMENYSLLFLSQEEIDKAVEEIKELLFHYDTSNSEIFSRQISQISDKKTVLEIKRVLEKARNLYNIIIRQGQAELLDKLDFYRLNECYKETVHHLALLNQREALTGGVDTTNLINTALENVLFLFRKISEAEMIIADQLKDTLRKTREALAGNFDQKDPEFVTLFDELKRLFAKKNLDEITQEEMKENIALLGQLFDRAVELNRKNDLLKAKYGNDAKYARLHKRILEKGTMTKKESALHTVLMNLKQETDDKVLDNSKLLENASYFTSLLMPLVLEGFEKAGIALTPEQAKWIDEQAAKEYLNEYEGESA